MRVELKRIQKEAATHDVFVTHDQEEALTLGDRIAVMHAGRLEQVGTPTEVYYQPATRFVASFIGDMNFLHGTVLGPSATPETSDLMLEIGGAVQAVSGCFADRRQDLRVHPAGVRSSRGRPSRGGATGRGEVRRLLRRLVCATSWPSGWFRRPEPRSDRKRDTIRCGQHVGVAWPQAALERLRR